LAISGTQYKEGDVERLQGTGEELASYYYKGGYNPSNNFVNQRNTEIGNLVKHKFSCVIIIIIRSELRHLIKQLFTYWIIGFRWQIDGADIFPTNITFPERFGGSSASFTRGTGAEAIVVLTVLLIIIRQIGSGSRSEKRLSGDFCGFTQTFQRNAKRYVD
jgi:hypothetical protein